MYAYVTVCCLIPEPKADLPQAGPASVRLPRFFPLSYSVYPAKPKKELTPDTMPAASPGKVAPE